MVRVVTSRAEYPAALIRMQQATLLTIFVAARLLNVPSVHSSQKYHLAKIDYRLSGCGGFFFFEIIKAVIFEICCCIVFKKINLSRN